MSLVWGEFAITIFKQATQGGLVYSLLDIFIDTFLRKPTSL